MSRDLNDLIPSFRTPILDVLDACRQQGHELRPYFTLRDPWTQARLWRQSRAAAQITRQIERLRDNGAPWLANVLHSVGPQSGPPVTNALPGASWHQWGEAVDCFLVDASGGANWDGAHPGYRAYAEAARALGLTGGYFWTDPFDPGHIQARPESVEACYTLAEIDAAMRQRFTMGADPAMPAPLASGPEPAEETEPDPSDVDILARTLYGEARGESTEGQAAVGHVIRNRVRIAQARGGHWWGNTIREVCLKPWQFSCWNPNDPNRPLLNQLTPANPDFRPLLHLARAVLTSNHPNPIRNATHYHADYIAPPTWTHTATYVTRIGRHHFYENVR